MTPIGDAGGRAGNAAGGGDAEAFPSAVAAMAPDALVLFCDARDRWWQRLLKPGFRHCLVLIRIGSHWLACDSLWHGLEFHLLPARKWNPVGFFSRRGFTVVAVRRRENRDPFPVFGPFTCVQVACRALGIPGAWILTPWQLYRKLIFLSSEKIC